jgi:hypothetical protein
VKVGKLNIYGPIDINDFARKTAGAVSEES